MMRTRLISLHVLVVVVLSVALVIPAHASDYVHVEGFGERGLQINCVTAGGPSEAADLPVAILLHGFGGSSFSFRGILEPMADALGTCAIAFDRPAFGFTSRPVPPSCGYWHEARDGRNPYTLAAAVEITFRVADALAPGKPLVLIGHSAGAEVAVAAALARPDRVAGLVLIAPAVALETTSQSNSSLVKGVSRMPCAGAIGAWVLRLIAPRLSTALSSMWHDKSKLTQDIVDGYMAPLKPPVGNWARALWEFTVARSYEKDAPTMASLQQIAAPCLVIAGAQDSVVPIAHSRIVAQSIPGAVIATIDESGHLPHEEQEADTLEAIRVFLSRVGLSRRHGIGRFACDTQQQQPSTCNCRYTVLSCT
jgi:pimeloyl-ACP methyl ester carboxylesterase